MKRLGFLIVIAIIALSFFSSAYSKRNEPANDKLSQKIEMQEIGVKLDDLTGRIEKLKSDMAAIKHDLIKSRIKITKAH